MKTTNQTGSKGSPTGGMTGRGVLWTMTTIATAVLLAACGGDDDGDASAATAPSPNNAALAFDASKYTTVNVSVDGVPMKVRQYKVVYVAKPIRMASTLTTGSTVALDSPYELQSMNINVPEAMVNDQKTALYFAVNNSGWFASPVRNTVKEGSAFASTNTAVPAATDAPNIGAALKAGYVVIEVGTRSRGARAEEGSWVGKAPAPVVDAKAAIRYLRLNDTVMPGSAERIVMNGTSGGGGLTAAVAASGNSADYLPDLAAIGAAGVDGSGSSFTSSIKDDIFAAVAYCPINNLGNADAGYEFEYSAVRNDTNTGALGGVAYSAGPQTAASTAIASTFAAYVASLNLKQADGTPVTATTLRDTTAGFVREEVQRQIAAGTAVPPLGGNLVTTRKTLVNDWLTLSGTGTSAMVANVDYPKFVNYVAANQPLKTVVAFDAVGVTGNRNATTNAWNISGESTLFGSASFQYSNFTDWSWTNNAVLGDGTGRDNTNQTWAQYLASTNNSLATQLKLINPIPYLGSTSADAAPYWYVRHGMVDRDTAFVMQSLLYQAIRNDTSVKDLNFKLPYLVGHAGNYDVQEAFTWIKAKLDSAP